MLDTKLSVQEIEDSLLLYFGGKRNNLVVPNVSWGLLPYEADLLVMNKSGYLTEFEIKRSFSDFMADFKKDEKAHNAPIIYKFYYVVPLNILDKVLAVLKEKAEADKQEMPAVISYDEKARLKLQEGNPYRFNARKLFLEERLQLARLGTMRYWSLREKMNKNKREEQK